jgi:hypothetical protein
LTAHSARSARLLRKCHGASPKSNIWFTDEVRAPRKRGGSRAVLKLSRPTCQHPAVNR